MGLSILVVVPCAGRKIWDIEPDHGPAKAKDVYKSPPFKVNKAFAEKFADRWIILSAKYGFIDPDFVIHKNYSVTFKKASTNPITMDQIKLQLKGKKLEDFDVVISLGGKDYTDIAKRVFSKISKVVVPTDGLRIGNAMKRVKTLMGLKRPEMLKEVIESSENC